MIHCGILSQSLASQNKIRYDEACKRLLSEKIILAWIMKTCLKEYRDLDVEEIATQYIEGMPQIGKMLTARDISDTPLIHGSATEDVTVTGEEIDYDI